MARISGIDQVRIFGTHTGYLVAANRRVVDERFVERFRNFCGLTAMAMATDERDFRSSDPAIRERARARFSESSIIHHDVESVGLCVDDLATASVENMCLVGPDFACLADEAKRLQAAIRDVLARVPEEARR